MKNDVIIKPFLKWAGGKRQLINELKKNIPQKFNIDQNIYYEPFVGAGALFLTLQPQKAVVNDANTELINCYQVIRDSVEELIDELAKHKKDDEDYYYTIREWDRFSDFQNKTKVERASRIIFLNKTCYNGLFRVNSQGQFNVPFGRYKNPNFLEENVLRAISQYLNNPNIKILNTDFENAIEDAKEGDFIYFDPPYDPLSDTASFTSYAKNKFDINEQKRLKATVDHLTERGCYILLSNAHTDLMTELYQDYDFTIVPATRAINSNASKRGKVGEILVRNYDLL